jgi:hypothetical protein
MKHRNQRILLPALLFLASWLLPEASSGTTLLRLSIEKMSREAAAIVVGEVEKETSGWNAQQTTIYTYTTVKVERCIAGFCTEKMLLKHRGGTVGETTLYIPGMPRFSRGQKVLLFLRFDPEGQPGYHAVFGMCQGMFELRENDEDGKTYAVQQGGATLVEPDERGKLGVAVDAKPLELPLERLIERIEKARKDQKTGEGSK